MRPVLTNGFSAHFRSSGLPNFCSVSLALHEYGYQAVGLRIDSGDLAFLSLMVRDAFKRIAKQYVQTSVFQSSSVHRY